MLLLLVFGLRMGGDSQAAAVATPNVCVTLYEYSRLDLTLAEVSRLDLTLTETSRISITLDEVEC